jgi:hypothetical protein
MLSPYVVGTALSLFAVIDFLARSVAFTLAACGFLMLNRHDHIRPAYQSVFLFCVAPAPLLSAALSFWRLRLHKTSGRYDEKLVRTLRFFNGFQRFRSAVPAVWGIIPMFSALRGQQ